MCLVIFVVQNTEHKLCQFFNIYIYQWFTVFRIFLSVLRGTKALPRYPLCYRLMCAADGLKKYRAHS